ncbi:MAG: hypothetical protein LAT76_07480 [Schleiferiaceae bacterium]|nr:hypothetical protein [Schleiferiaceae bacterium]
MKGKLVLTFLVTSFCSFAQLPFAESFKGAAAPGVIFGGDKGAFLTAATGIDPLGDGFLRLTDNTANQTGFVYNDAIFLPNAGLKMEFEFYHYGGNGADGTVFFLFDGSVTNESFQIGAFGGSLGYAQRFTNTPGVSKGYLGIGIDEFGNFSAPTEGRQGGPDRKLQSITLRGAGNGTGPGVPAGSNYPYLTHTQVQGDASNPFNFSLDPQRGATGGRITNPNLPGYRKISIRLKPRFDSNNAPLPGYLIDVDIITGGATPVLNEVIKDFVYTTPFPNTLRFGFAASTGGSNNFHEIRNLTVEAFDPSLVPPPVAGNTNDKTCPGSQVGIDVKAVANLENPDFNKINFNSFDFDAENTTSITEILTIPGVGTFEADATYEVVVFTADPAFTGTHTIKYSFTDFFGNRSNTGEITVNGGGTACGLILNDTNGMTDNEINGATIFELEGIPLYVNYIEGTEIKGSALVDFYGAWMLDMPINTGGTFQLTRNQGALNATAPATLLPINWTYTAEGITTTGDGTPDGEFTATGSAVLSNLNFGVQHLPVPVASFLSPRRPNPGGTLMEVVPNEWFGGTDLDGTVEKVRLTQFPTNATSFSIDAMRYYPNAAATPNATDCPTGFTCVDFSTLGSLEFAAPTNTSGANVPLIQIDPIDNNASGFRDCRFIFRLIDNADGVSLNTGALDVRFQGLRELTLTAVTSLCINDVPYLRYVLQSNFDPRGLPVSYTWTSGSQAVGIGNPSVALIPTVSNVFTPSTERWSVNSITSYVLVDTLLWPGAAVSSAGEPTDWPAWELVGSEWHYQEDGFSGYTTNPSISFDINPSVSATSLTYPPATPTCAGGPTISIAGTIWNDVNGSANGTFFNIFDTGEQGTNTGGMAVILTQNNPSDPTEELIFALTSVNADGTYSFENLARSNYNIYIVTDTDTLPIVDLLAVADVFNASDWELLPIGWEATSPLSRQNFDAFEGADRESVDFGIQQLPSSGAVDVAGIVLNNQLIQPTFNKGFFGGMEIDSRGFGGSDPDGEIIGLFLVDLSANIRSFSSGDTTFYRDPLEVPSAADCPTAFCRALGSGAFVPSNTAGQPTPDVSIATMPGYIDSGFPIAGHPLHGDLEISYKTVDNAGSHSLNSTTLTIPVVALKYQNGAWHNGSTDTEPLGSSNTLVNMPNEEDGDKTLFWLDDGGTLEKFARVQNLYIAEDVTAEVSACLEVIGNASNDGGVLQLTSSASDVFGQYLGPALNDVLVEMVMEGLGWHNIGAPVNITAGQFKEQNEGTISITGDANTSNLQFYDSEVSGGKEIGFQISRNSSNYGSHAYGTWFPADETQAMNTFGHSIFLSSNFGVAGTSQKYTMKGQTIAEDLTYGTHNNFGGWNLLPNPYPVIIDAQKMDLDNFFTDNDLERAVWLWDPNDNEGAGAYRALDIVSGIPVDPALIAPNALIAPFQGFYVRRIDASTIRRANHGNAPGMGQGNGVGRGNDVDPSRGNAGNPPGLRKNIIIKEEYRTICEATRFFKTQTQQDVIKLVVSNNTSKNKDYTQLSFSDDFENEYNPVNDVSKQFHNHRETPHLFSIEAQQPLTINRRNIPSMESSVLLGFYALSDNEEYTISMPVVPDFYTVFLEDLKTGAWHPLSEDPDYIFKNDANYDIERFKLHFVNGHSNMERFTPNAKAWGSADGITVRFHNLIQTEAHIRITDVLGRRLFDKRGIPTTGDFVFATNEALPQLYIITIITEQLTTVEKVVR